LLQRPLLSKADSLDNLSEPPSSVTSEDVCHEEQATGALGRRPTKNDDCDWLLRFMQGNHSKFLSKAELREAVLRELNVSKNSFDFGWIDAIAQTGRHDWYEPLRRRCAPKAKFLVPGPLGRDKPLSVWSSDVS
jgi:hypothetical protein